MLQHHAMLVTARSHNYTLYIIDMSCRSFPVFIVLSLRVEGFALLLLLLYGLRSLSAMPIVHMYVYTYICRFHEDE